MAVMSAEIRYYNIASHRDSNVATYALSVLETIAAGADAVLGETPAEYAQRHLDVMVERGHITPWMHS